MRRSQRDIDSDIVDTAAGLFAAQGFERTSVQQIADAVGYSKTGLLHHFPSKQALLDAVQELIDDALAAVQNFGSSLPGDDRDQRTLLTMITETALRHPGLVQYLIQGLNAMQPGGDTVPPSVRIDGERIIELITGPAATAEQHLRVILALELICTGVLLGREPEHHSLQGRLGPVLIELAERVIGTSPATTIEGAH